MQITHSNIALVSLCILSMALLAGPGTVSAAAKSKKEPVYEELPGQTSPTVATVAQAQPAASTNPALPTAVTPAAQPSSTPPSTAPAPAPEQTRGKTLYSFTATDLDLKTALATFARANSLNIVPDNDVVGIVTVDVRELPLDEMMRALLEASDCAWSEERGLIRVRNSETRMFTIDYLRLSRNSTDRSTATLGSGSSGGGGGGASGGGSGGSGGNTSFGAGSSTVNLSANNPVDFWTELVAELDLLLTEKGKSSMAINKTAGVIQVTDRPSALRRAETYIKSVQSGMNRQVEIEAKLYDVTLNDQFQFGIDWVHIAEAYGGTLGFGTATLPIANGGGQLGDSTIGGLNRIVGTTTPGSYPATLVFQNFNTAAAVTALKQQGSVEVISTPRIRTLNNQTALIKVGEEVPFFNTTTTFLPGTTAGTSTTVQQTVVNSITIGTILSITPQISSDDRISLDISPVLTSLKSVATFGGSGGNGSGGGGGGGGGGAGASATAADLDTKQASTIVRVHDGNTVVLGGLIQTENAKNDNKVPLLGDIPGLGKLFRGTFRFKQRKELVIFVTPHIVRDNETSAPMPATVSKF